MSPYRAMATPFVPNLMFWDWPTQTYILIQDQSNPDLHTYSGSTKPRLTYLFRTDQTHTYILIQDRSNPYLHTFSGFMANPYLHTYLPLPFPLHLLLPFPLHLPLPFPLHLPLPFPFQLPLHQESRALKSAAWRQNQAFGNSST